MGCFSWIASDDKKAVRMGEEAYLLIPQECGGGYYHTSSYDCYGNIDVDVYDALADFNKPYIDIDKLDPPTPKEKFGGLWNFEKEELLASGKTQEEIDILDEQTRTQQYENALRRHEETANMILDFKNMSEEEFVQKFGSNKKREVGIELYFNYSDLKYPLVITHKPGNYEDFKASEDDPYQGL